MVVPGAGVEKQWSNLRFFAFPYIFFCIPPGQLAETHRRGSLSNAPAFNSVGRDSKHLDGHRALDELRERKERRIIIYLLIKIIQ